MDSLRPPGREGCTEPTSPESGPRRARRLGGNRPESHGLDCAPRRGSGAYMKPIEKVLERLEGIERRNGGYMTLCPAHDDHTPSLSVSEGDGGKALVRCFAGCATVDVLDALGLSARDLFERGERNNGRRTGNRKPSVIWQVKDAAGDVQALHTRFDRNGDKEVLWRLPGAHRWGLGGRKLSTLPLYRSEHIATWPKGAHVVVVEGEKAADALASIYPPVLGTVT